MAARAHLVGVGADGVEIERSREHAVALRTQPAGGVTERLPRERDLLAGTGEAHLHRREGIAQAGARSAAFGILCVGHGDEREQHDGGDEVGHRAGAEVAGAAQTPQLHPEPVVQRGPDAGHEQERGDHRHAPRRTRTDAAFSDRRGHEQHGQHDPAERRDHDGFRVTLERGVVEGRHAHERREDERQPCAPAVEERAAGDRIRPDRHCSPGTTDTRFAGETHACGEELGVRHSGDLPSGYPLR